MYCSSVSKSELKVVAGSNDGTTGDKFSVKNTVTHPNYDSYSYSYDYALVQIKGTFTWGDTVTNVSLPSTNPTANTKFVVAGYGDTVSCTHIHNTYTVVLVTLKLFQDQ